jgi:hypothetical protein
MGGSRKKWIFLFDTKYVVLETRHHPLMLISSMLTKALSAHYAGCLLKRKGKQWRYLKKGF